MRDRALVEQFQAGDVAGFEDLYRRYYGRLYRFCLKRVGDPLEAEELTQESFVRAFRALSGFAGERRFYPWLSVIAARLCVDNHRRKARTEPSADIDLGMTDGGQEKVIDAVDIDLLNQALARLGPRHREVLRLREEEGWSYQHIASHYGVSLGTVEALLWRARRALKREFIAVAGPEGGAAAGVPFIGWLVRRMHSLRMRVGQWADHALPAVANGAVSMAVVVGSSAGLTALVSDGPSAATASGAESIVRVASNQVAVPADAPLADSSAATPAAVVHTSAPASSAAPGSLNTPSAVQPFARVNNSADGQREINNSAIQLNLGVVSIGANPSVMIPHALQALEQSIKK
ncbi:MAG: sigma-70 family RNA polymerase sigma factor [Actinobacteria bacterium]|nr:sigma-70 family RNA polymerase sigma factor [Actinomycetota bacterium]MBV8958179.1 sigma-70 family RNA polymerase sigma factor [Actinomycetota bacterium]MBV9254480.1 sigma-70 family RNA polymerase sigma factor [Actinomycetota bacterium]